MTPAVLKWLNCATSKDKTKERFYRVLNFYRDGGVMTTDGHRIHCIGDCSGCVVRQFSARSFKEYKKLYASKAGLDDVVDPQATLDDILPKHRTNKALLPLEAVESFGHLRDVNLIEISWHVWNRIRVRVKDLFFGLQERKDLSFDYLKGETCFYVNGSYWYQALGKGVALIRCSDERLAPIEVLGWVDGIRTRAVVMPMNVKSL
jgi:hypothetical protein